MNDKPKCKTQTLKAPDKSNRRKYFDSGLYKNFLGQFQRSGTVH